MDQDGLRKFKEKTLKEMSFTTISNTNWDKITEPRKSNLFNLLKKMILDYENTNVKIQIGEVIFHCHMIVLQCYSEYFSDKTLEQVIVLPNDKITPRAFIMIYTWMLDDKPIVQREYFLELFNAAIFLNIDQLIAQCWSCIDDTEKFYEDSAFFLYIEAKNFNLKFINDLMLIRINRFFLSFVASKEFLEFSAEEICTLFKSNAIAVNSEFDVLMSAVRWLDGDWKNRKKYLLDIMKCIRFDLMLPWQLLKLQKESNSLQIEKFIENSEIMKIIDDNMSYITTKFWNLAENKYSQTPNLNIKVSQERQWIKDDLLQNDSLDSLDRFIYTYESFLKYLEMIQALGPNHWKSLKFSKENPNFIFKKTEIMDVMKAENPIKNSVVKIS